MGSKPSRNSRLMIEPLAVSADRREEREGMRAGYPRSLQAKLRRALHQRRELLVELLDGALGRLVALGRLAGRVGRRPRAGIGELVLDARQCGLRIGDGALECGDPALGVLGDGGPVALALAA